MSERSYTVKYSVGGVSESKLYLGIDERSIYRTEEFIGFMQRLNFVFCNRNDYSIYQANLDNLALDEVKYIMDRYRTSLVGVEVVYSNNDITQLYPTILGTIDLQLSIDHTCKEHLFYFQVKESKVDLLLDTFDINGLGFESCYNDSKIRIAVRDETEFKKMKLIGLVDFMHTHFLEVSLVLTNTLFDRLQWKF